MDGDDTKINNLEGKDKRILEKLFDMEGGYVLDFSNQTMSDFFQDEFGIDIYDKKYDLPDRSSSKANRLRGIFKNENSETISKIIISLIERIREKELLNNTPISEHKNKLITEAEKIINKLSNNKDIDQFRKIDDETEYIKDIYTLYLIIEKLVEIFDISCAGPLLLTDSPLLNQSYTIIRRAYFLVINKYKNNKKYSNRNTIKNIIEEIPEFLSDYDEIEKDVWWNDSGTQRDFIRLKEIINREIVEYTTSENNKLEKDWFETFKLVFDATQNETIKGFDELKKMKQNEWEEMLKTYDNKDKKDEINTPIIKDKSLIGISTIEYVSELISKKYSSEKLSRRLKVFNIPITREITENNKENIVFELISNYSSDIDKDYKKNIDKFDSDELDSIESYGKRILEKIDNDSNIKLEKLFSLITEPTNFPGEENIAKSNLKNINKLLIKDLFVLSNKYDSIKLKRRINEKIGDFDIYNPYIDFCDEKFYVNDLLKFLKSESESYDDIYIPDIEYSYELGINGQEDIDYEQKIRAIEYLKNAGVVKEYNIRPITNRISKGGNSLGMEMNSNKDYLEYDIDYAYIKITEKLINGNIQKIEIVKPLEINLTKEIMLKNKKTKEPNDYQKTKKIEKEFNGLSYWTDGSITFKDEDIILRAQLRDLLRLFISNPNKIMTFDDIKDTIIKSENRGKTKNSNISKYVNELERELKKYTNNIIIKNENETGYKIIKV